MSQVSGADTSRNFPVVANAGNGHLVAVWLEVIDSATRVQFSHSTNWGASWMTPRAVVSTGTSVFPWMDARGAKVAVMINTAGRSLVTWTRSINNVDDTEIRFARQR